MSNGSTELQSAFVRAYPMLRAACGAPNAPGVALFAIPAGRPPRITLVPASRDGIRTATIGRHVECDLPVEDPTFAPRQLVVVLHPLGEDRLWFRLVDLRSEAGMRDERGNPVAHCVSDGPMFVTIGTTSLFVIPLADRRLKWPADAVKAWKELPPRMFRPVAPADVGPVLQSVLGPPPTPGDPDATLVQDLPGPRFARPVRRLDCDRSPSDGTPVAELLLASSEGASASILVDAAAARAGVLIGRDDRCDTSSVPLFTDRRISRVHMLLLEVEGVVYAIDTASTNGVWRGGDHAGGVALQFGQRLAIARSLAWLKWMPPPVALSGV